MEKIYLKRRVCVAAAVLSLVLLFFIFCVHIIPTGYTGVKVHFGQVLEKPYESGRVVFTMPLVSRLIRVNNKQQDLLIEGHIWGEASDKTPVYASEITVTYQISPERSVWICSNVTGYARNLVSSEIVASAVKAAMVKLSPEEVTVRSSIEPLVKEMLQSSLDEKYGEGAVTVNKIVINDMDFDAAYDAALTAKSLAQLAYEKQQIDNESALSRARTERQIALTQAESNADAILIEAGAKAEANRILALYLTDTLIEYRKAEKWNGVLPKVYAGGAMLDLGNILEEAG